jgi:hypothetical protein
MYGREKRKEIGGKKNIYKTNRRNWNTGTGSPVGPGAVKLIIDSVFTGSSIRPV